MQDIYEKVNPNVSECHIWMVVTSIQMSSMKNRFNMWSDNDAG